MRIKKATLKEQKPVFRAAVPSAVTPSTECYSSKMECPSSKEINLKKLAQSNILKNFVSENGGFWDHQKWLELCDEISMNGYSPVDFDQVGLMLEQEKTAYFNQK